jgi:hypothetical protein
MIGWPDVQRIKYFYSVATVSIWPSEGAAVALHPIGAQ